jgi:TRAP-type C4-dicarboxylate transport system permease small subunit
MGTRLQRAFDAVYGLGIVIACLCLGAQLVIITINVILRYFFASGISWVEEISKDVLMTAFTFIAMAIGVKLDTHISVDVFPRAMPRWFTIGLEKLKFLLLAGVGLFLMVKGVSLMTLVRGSIASAPMLPITLQYVSVPFAGLLILADSILRLLGLEAEDHVLDGWFMGVGERDER